jgi:hypothetical protein
LCFFFGPCRPLPVPLFHLILHPPFKNSLCNPKTGLNLHKHPMCHTPNCIYYSRPAWSSHQISPIHTQKQKLLYDTGCMHISTATLCSIPKPPFLEKGHTCTIHETASTLSALYNAATRHGLYIV